MDKSDLIMNRLKKWIFAFAVYLVTSNTGFAKSAVEGIWQGIIIEQGVEQRLIFTIKRNEYHKLTAHLDAPDDGWMRIPATISQELSKIAISLPTIDASLTGELMHGGKFIEAQFIWQGQVTPIRLRAIELAPPASAAIYSTKLSNNLLAEYFDRLKTVSLPEFENTINETGNMSHLNAVLIYSHGKLILEEYFNQLDENTLANIKSVNKSLLSILVGIAIDNKFINNIDETIGQYLPNYKVFREDRVKMQIRIRDLLNMRAGFDYDEMASYRFGEHPIWDSRDWVRQISELNMAHKPGERYRYGTVQTHLLSAILTNATGMDTLSFANKYLFHPLNIDGVVWYRSQKGVYMGGSDMFLTPREMLQIGQLYLNKGLYKQRQIVSKQWVERSLIGDFPEEKISDTDHYGYLWKRFKIRGMNAYRAAGFGGQFIINIPELDTSIVTTANPNYLSEGERNADEVMQLVVKLVDQVAANQHNVRKL